MRAILLQVIAPYNLLDGYRVSQVKSHDESKKYIVSNLSNDLKQSKIRVAPSGNAPCLNIVYSVCHMYGHRRFSRHDLLLDNSLGHFISTCRFLENHF